MFDTGMQIVSTPPKSVLNGSLIMDSFFRKLSGSAGPFFLLSDILFVVVSTSRKFEVRERVAVGLLRVRLRRQPTAT
jgi:hypothetical protein